MSQNNSTEIYLDRNTSDSHLIAYPSQDGAFQGTNYGLFVLILACLFLIFVNSLLLHTIVVARKRKQTWVKHTRQMFYLIVCDLFAALGLFLNNTVRLFTPSTNTYWQCAMLHFTAVSTQSAAFYHMLSVCIHRFRKLKTIDLPFGNDAYRYGVESVIIWISVLLISVIPFVILDGKDDTPACRIDVLFEPSDEIFFTIYFLALCGLPCLLTNMLYCGVLCRMRIRLNQVQPSVHFRNAQDATTSNEHEASVSINLQQPTSNSVIGQTTNKVNRIIGYLLLVLNISALGPVLTAVMKLNGQELVGFVPQLIYINNIFSPFIYSLSIAPLRTELKAKLWAWVSLIKSVLVCSNR